MVMTVGMLSILINIIMFSGLVIFWSKLTNADSPEIIVSLGPKTQSNLTINGQDIDIINLNDMPITIDLYHQHLPLKCDLCDNKATRIMLKENKIVHQCDKHRITILKNKQQ